jgi:protein TonB
VIEYSKLRQADPGRRLTGMVVVGLLHLIIGYLAVSGLGKRLVEVIKPTETKVIEEPKVEPPPPEIIKTPPPKLEAPPPPYIPPPIVEISSPPPAQPTITAQRSETPPPVYQPQRTVEAPPAPPAPPAAPKATSIGVACPTQVRPEMPAKAANQGVSGSVRARLTIKGGRVVNVEIISARPRGYFEAAVRSAVSQYGCVSGGDQELVAEQTFDFSLDD